MKIVCCVCRGAGTVDESKLRGLHLRVLCTVRDSSPVGITLSQLVDAVYADDPEGGPLYANLVVQQTIRRINQRIGISNYQIKATRLGRGARYRMVKLSQTERSSHAYAKHREHAHAQA